MAETPWKDISLLLDGILCTGEEILSRPCDAEGFSGDIRRFLAQWFDDRAWVPGETSGSTGAPKALRLEKIRMMASARMTCDFLGLRPGDSTLLCMPLRYIGAKMVVVRAMVAGLNLVWTTPSSHPLRACPTPPCFAAMTPMQVMASLECPAEARLMRDIRHLLIGGAPVTAELAEAVRDFPYAVWSTYGMTETLSHIALRRCNGPEASLWYTPLEGVTLSLSPEGTLVIDAPHLHPERLVTNDIAQLEADGRFRIVGRKDNVINSGGVKIQIEEMEAMLSPHLACPFQVTSIPDAHTGEQVVMLVEGDTALAREGLRNATLPRYWEPKRIFAVDALPRTGSGKPDRARAKKMAKDATLD